MVEKSKEVKAKPEKVEVQKADKPAPKTEVWWSVADPTHMICIPSEKNDPKTGRPLAASVRFDRYRLELDLSTDEGKLVSRGLHNCPRNGRDIFIIGQDYDGDFGKAEDIAQGKMLREISLESDGIAKLKALFSHKELVDGGVNPLTNSPDELIYLAQKLQRTPKGV